MDGGQALHHGLLPGELAGDGGDDDRSRDQCVSIRSALVVGAAGAIASGTSASAVSTAAVRTNVLRGRRANRP